MKPKNIQQEIMVPTTTTFSQKTLSEIKEDAASASAEEELEKAFWNGLLYEMFPEFRPEELNEGSKLFIWQVVREKAGLFVEMAEAPGTIEPLDSIDPYLFLAQVNMN